MIRILGSLRSNLDYVAVGTALGATALGLLRDGVQAAGTGDRERPVDLLRHRAVRVRPGTYAGGRASLLAAMLKATRLLTLYGLAAGTALAVVARDAIPVLFSAQWTPAVSTGHALIAISLGGQSISLGQW